MKIPVDVLEVLGRSIITENSLKLPEGQLERGLYLAVAKVLKAAGGKWSKKEQAHVFNKDPREVLGLAIDSGTIVSEKVTLQAFYTPPEIAEKLVGLVELKPRMKVLEPSAGEGALVKAILKKNPRVFVTAIDINPDIEKSLLEIGNEDLEIRIEDFLKAKFKKGRDFRAIVMNPPFTKGQDIKHVLHALNYLAHDGVLVSIVSAGSLANSTKPFRVFQELVKDHGQVREVEAGAFKASGTMVKTAIVKFENSPELLAHLIELGLTKSKEIIGELRDSLNSCLSREAKETKPEEPSLRGPQLSLFE